MIELSGNSDKVFDIVEAQISECRDAHEQGYAESIAIWVWDHYASQDGAPGREYSRFEAPYDTWDEVVEAYNEDQFSRYEESRIG